MIPFSCLLNLGMREYALLNEFHHKSHCQPYIAKDLGAAHDFQQEQQSPAPQVLHPNNQTLVNYATKESQCNDRHACDFYTDFH